MHRHTLSHRRALRTPIFSAKPQQLLPVPPTPQVWPLSPHTSIVTQHLPIVSREGRGATGSLCKTLIWNSTGFTIVWTKPEGKGLCFYSNKLRPSLPMRLDVAVYAGTNSCSSHPLGRTGVLQNSLCQPVISKHLIFQWEFNISSSSVLSELPHSPSDDAKIRKNTNKSGSGVNKLGSKHLHEASQAPYMWVGLITSEEKKIDLI